MRSACIKRGDGLVHNQPPLRIKQSVPGRIFNILNYLILAMVALLALIPFVYVFTISFVSRTEFAMSGTGLILWPKRWVLDAYKYVFASNTIPRALLNSIGITVVGTLMNIAFTSMMGFALSRKDLAGRKIIRIGVIFAMLFNGGMIPTFLVVKMYGLIDSYWSLILPTAVMAFNLMVMTNFFSAIPYDIQESAIIDGCNDLQVFWRIILPLSKASLASFALFYAVGHWNSYFNAVLYINSSEKWPVQVWLRQIVIMSQGGLIESAESAESFPPPQSIKMAVIMVSTLPILVVYPFLQKYFAKGVMMGSLKG